MVAKKQETKLPSNSQNEAEYLEEAQGKMRAAFGTAFLGKRSKVAKDPNSIRSSTKGLNIYIWGGLVLGLAFALFGYFSSR